MVTDCPTAIGRHLVERELGRGAMGVVYRAFDPVVERTVAIKTIALGAENSGQLLERLRREARSAGHLEHPNIVTLYDAVEDQGTFYLVMQYVAGETLREWLDRRRGLELAEIRDLFSQICSGLHYAHERGVIHRDVKPANILITPQGEVKVTDFGIAKLCDSSTVTRGAVMGTPSYMSPEKARGESLDRRSDIFSLGSILYELVTGERPFKAEATTAILYKIVHEPPVPPIFLRPALDVEAQEIILTALAKDKSARFQTCLGLAQALDAYVDASALTRSGPATKRVDRRMRPPTRERRANAWKARVGAFVALFTCAVALVAVLGLRYSWQPSGRKDRRTNKAILYSQSASAPPVSSEARTEPLQLGQSPRISSLPDFEQGTRPEGNSTSPGSKISITDVPRRSSVYNSNWKRLAAGLTPQPSATNRGQTPGAPTGATKPPQPGPFDALLVEGDLALLHSEYADAVASYSKAYRLNPQSKLVQRRMYDLLMLLGMPSEAQLYK